MSKIEVDAIEPQSGTTLTVGASGDTVTVPSGVTLDTSNSTLTLPDNSVTTNKIADSNITLAKLSATGTKDATTFLRGDNSFATIAGGLSEADQWRLNTSLSVGSSTDITITANLERVDTAPQGYLGTGMSESSGIFTFPSTGIWLVQSDFQFSMDNATNRYLQTFIIGTTDNFSTQTKLTETTGSTIAISGGNYVNVFGQTIIDCTNTTTHKVKFAFNMASTGGSPVVYGSSTSNRTYFTFTKLGDT